jgi:hypothetical protein
MKRFENKPNIYHALTRMKNANVFSILTTQEYYELLDYLEKYGSLDNDIFQMDIIEVVFGLKYISNIYGFENLKPRYLPMVDELSKFGEKYSNISIDTVSNDDEVNVKDAICDINDLLYYLNLKKQEELIEDYLELSKVDEKIIIANYTIDGEKKSFEIEIGKSFQFSNNPLTFDKEKNQIKIENYFEILFLAEGLTKIADLKDNLKLIHLGKYDAWCVVEVIENKNIIIKVPKNEIGYVIGMSARNLTNIKNKYGLKNRFTVIS